MTGLAVIVACIVGGAFGRRMLGGQFKTWFGIDPGHWPLRLLFGALACGPLAFVVWWPVAVAFALSVAVGEAEGYKKGAMDPDQTGEFLNAAEHAVLGTATTIAVALGLGYHWWVFILLVTILACPAAYGWAKKFPVQWEFVAAHRATAEHPADPAPWGEMLWGGARSGIIAAFVVVLSMLSIMEW